MSKYNDLQKRVDHLASETVVKAPLGHGTCSIGIKKAVEMMLDYLGLVYESGYPTTAKFVKPLTSEQLKRAAGLKD